MKYNRTELKTISVNTDIKKAVIYMTAFLFFNAITALAAEPLDKPAVNSVASPSLEKSDKVYFSLVDEFGGPKTQAKQRFDCSDQIFTVAELSNYPKGKYQLTVVWKDPIDEIREKTTYPFNVHNTQTRIWAWLTLSRATGAGLIQWIDPAAGLESFIGAWTIEVLIDGKRISKQTIDVSC